MVDKFRSISESPVLAALVPLSNIATPTSTSTETPKPEMPHSMGAAGRLIMSIAESVLPKMVMNMVTEFMHSTNGLVYSGMF